MKKVIGFLLILIPISYAALKIAVYLNNGEFNAATIITAVFIGAVYILVALGFYDSDD